ncbi:hypothetical protein [Pseudoalteromonas lipolytica]|nr:hypothetical protein [Pseudoalteromonas lipolytica]MBE0351881.1 hypothetical protein [Pseudoalteromonas lipolytica LMEB 39]
MQLIDMNFTEENNYTLVIERDETTDSDYKMSLELTVTKQS